MALLDRTAWRDDRKQEERKGEVEPWTVTARTQPLYMNASSVYFFLSFPLVWLFVSHCYTMMEMEHVLN